MAGYNNINLMKRNLIRMTVIAVFFCIALFLSVNDVHATAYTESESNDYVGEADSISVSTGNTFSGTIGTSETDFVKFTLSKGSIVEMKLSGTASSYDFYWNNVYIESEVYKGVDDYVGNSQYEYNYNLGYYYGNSTYYLSAGTYYMGISSFHIYESVKYKITFKTTPWENFKEPNNYIGEATKVINNKKYRGLIDDNESSDFFVISAPSRGAYYYITIKNIDVPDSPVYDFTIGLFDSDGNQLEFSDVDGYQINSSIAIKQGERRTFYEYLPSGKNYFKVHDGMYSGKYEITFHKQLPATSKVSTSLYGYDDIKVSWKPVTGATGYYVYIFDGQYGYPYWDYRGKTTSTVAKLKNLSDGEKKYIKVVPYKKINGKSYEGKERTSAGLNKLKKLKKPSVKKVSNSKVRVSWNNIPGESGYQIAQSRNKNSGYKIKKTVSSKYKTYTVSAKKYRTYYYKVRAYKKVGKTKIYAPWSAPKAYKLR